MFTIFLFGAPLFWLYAIAIFICITFAEENYRFGLASFELLLFFVGIAVFGNINIFTYVLHNPLMSIAASAIYFIIGGIVAIPKWSAFVKKRLEYIIQYKKDSAAMIGPNSPIAQSKNTYLVSMIPSASKDKSKIICWIVYWPSVVFWFLIKDLVFNIGEFIFNRIKFIFNNIRNKAFANVIAELPDDINID